MDAVDRRIVDALQGGFPVCERPFAAAAAPLGIGEAELIDRIECLLADGTLTRFGPLFDAEKLGGAFTLAAMQVPEGRFDAVAEIVNGFREVAHNYRRAHALNMWFVVATDSKPAIDAVLERIERATGLAVLAFPKEREYFVELRLPVRASVPHAARGAPREGDR
jgi:DNA-binding Lrp family transcriptional regulator